jgi:hypothetical protein
MDRACSMYGRENERREMHTYSFIVILEGKRPL